MRGEYRGLIGLSTISAFSFWLVQLIPWLRYRQIEKKKIENALNKIDSLSKEERLIIAYCIWKNQSTIYLPLNDPGCLALSQKGLIKPATNTGIGNTQIHPFIIPNFIFHRFLMNQS
ncbi:MAG: super-infection exclusion protein B [Nitrospinota bacterium]